MGERNIFSCDKVGCKKEVVYKNPIEVVNGWHWVPCRDERYLLCEECYREYEHLRIKLIENMETTLERFVTEE